MNSFMTWWFADEKLNLTPKAKKLVQGCLLVYIGFLIYMCFGPQHSSPSGVETPNIVYVGPMVFLWVPFNSLVSLGEITSLEQLIWVLGQNIANIFLLYPLLFGILLWQPQWRSAKPSLFLAFMISLSIECTQLLIDILWHANRVFEVDDLWTNTLGGVFAYWTFKRLTHLVNKL
ncbi:VanZ family protein [Streptococcus sp. zg-JUN1979]|uniref:VanZ family protein n=1 Tax=Streptococcus sp. zg-JUN1979 TaxID=3391450 RepID=UPI0039A44C99